MKVFMSWSGERSKLTAELLYGWVKCVIQASQPWISSKGIERGALWFSEINNELKDTTVGIICLTHENKNAPWILFEAGALTKGLHSNRVCTFLVDLNPADLQSPLAQFNHTLPNKPSMWSLVTTLNNGLDANRLEPLVLQRIFDTYWPQFESDFQKIIDNNPSATVVEPREDKDILAEILETTRNMSYRVRNLENRSAAPDSVGGGLRVVQAAAGMGGVGLRRSMPHGEGSQFSDGVNVAISYLEAGMKPEFVVNRLMLEHGFGRGASTEAVEVANMLYSAPIESTDS